MKMLTDRMQLKRSHQKGPQKANIFIDGAGKRQKDMMRGRIVMVGILLLAVYSVIGLRLTELANTEDQTAKNGGQAVNPLMLARPDLTDRNGEVMAKDLTTFSLSADPRKIAFPEEVVEQLAAVLPEINKLQILRRLRSDAKFAWIKRELTPAQQQEILNLGIPGLHFDTETRRFYPGGRVASHLVGHVDIDNHGTAGFEKFIDTNWLNDLRAVGFSETYRPKPVKMSIDMRVQHVVHDELIHAMERYQAVAAVGVVLDAKTGEVVAMSSLPDYDPNHPQKTLNSETLNRATAGVFEMGSTFKAMTTAMALESGRITMNDHIDATHPIRHGRFTIRDFHAKKRVLSVPEVFIYSSNIGTVKMAQAVGPNSHRNFLSKLGLLNASSHELPEIGKPIEPGKWKELSSMTISFGHGISVTPLQTVVAAAAILNGGKLIPPTFRPRTIEEANLLATQVVSPETSLDMRYLFRLNVEKGSGKRADVPGFYIGGKTGTAEKVVNGKYSSEKKLNSFLSAFPADDPQYVMLVMIDEPQPEEGQEAATAGLNAAPTTAAIIRRIGLTLGLTPRLDNYLNPIEVRN